MRWKEMTREDQVLIQILTAFPGRKHIIYFMLEVEHHSILLPLAWIRLWRQGLQERRRMEAAFRGLDKSKYVDEARYTVNHEYWFIF